MVDHRESLNFAERWLRDGLLVSQSPGFFQVIEVDMSACQTILKKLRQQGVKVTYTHLFVRATAIALKRHSTLHQLVSSSRRLYPGKIDIGLSVAGISFVAPVMVIKNAGEKSLRDIATEIINNRSYIREQENKQFAFLKKWGWIVPFGFLRRWILRFLLSKLWFRRQGVGTFQISCIPDVDIFVPFMFNTSAILGIGRVCERVLAIGGEVVVRPTVMISCCVDHKVWDGIKAAQFINELKQILELGELGEEI